MRNCIMRAILLPVAWLYAVALMGVPTLGAAEAPPRSVEPMTIKPEVIQQTPTAVQTLQPSMSAPFLLGTIERPENIFHDTRKHLEPIPNGCSQNSASLCFDYRTGHAVYKPMRTMLPQIPGMTPHNLSIRRDKIVAQYTFK